MSYQTRIWICLVNTVSEGAEVVVVVGSRNVTDLQSRRMLVIICSDVFCCRRDVMNAFVQLASFSQTSVRTTSTATATAALHTAPARRRVSFSRSSSSPDLARNRSAPTCRRYITSSTRFTASAASFAVFAKMYLIKRPCQQYQIYPIYLRGWISCVLSKLGFLIAVAPEAIPGRIYTVSVGY